MFGVGYYPIIEASTMSKEHMKIAYMTHMMPPVQVYDTWLGESFHPHVI